MKHSPLVCTVCESGKETKGGWSLRYGVRFSGHLKNGRNNIMGVIHSLISNMEAVNALSPWAVLALKKVHFILNTNTLQCKYAGRGDFGIFISFS